MKDNNPGLGNRFETEVESFLIKIAEHPGIYGYSYKQPYREVKLKTFPFSIVYKVNEHKKQVYISAIYHIRRSPQKKYRK